MMRIEKKKTNGVDALDGLMKKIEDFMKTLNWGWAKLSEPQGIPKSIKADINHLQREVFEIVWLT